MVAPPTMIYLSVFQVWSCPRKTKDFKAEPFQILKLSPKKDKKKKNQTKAKKILEKQRRTNKKWETVINA